MTRYVGKDGRKDGVVQAGREGHGTQTLTGEEAKPSEAIGMISRVWAAGRSWNPWGWGRVVCSEE